VLAQDYTFSPHGATFQHEDLRLDLPAVTHLRLTIVPNKGGQGVATLTSLAARDPKRYGRHRSTRMRKKARRGEAWLNSRGSFAENTTAARLVRSTGTIPPRARPAAHLCGSPGT
jgi:hypothetical protein